MDFIWWQIVIVVLVVTGCITWITKMLRKNKSNIFINKKEETTVGISSEESLEENNKLLEEDKIKDFIILIHKTINYMDKKQAIVSSIIRDQMNAADLKMKNFEAIANKVFYAAVFDEYGKSIDVMRETSYIIYHNSMRLGIVESMMKMKQSFRENHFNDKGENEFSEYVTEQANKLYYNWEMLFNEQYLVSLKPTQEDLRNKLHYQEMTIKSIFKDCFISAREIAAEKEEILKQLETDFDADCRSFSGSNIVGVC